MRRGECVLVARPAKLDGSSSWVLIDSLLEVLGGNGGCPVLREHTWHDDSESSGVMSTTGPVDCHRGARVRRSRSMFSGTIGGRRPFSRMLLGRWDVTGPDTYTRLKSMFRLYDYRSHGFAASLRAMACDASLSTPRTRWGREAIDRHAGFTTELQTPRSMFWVTVWRVQGKAAVRIRRTSTYSTKHFFMYACHGAERCQEGPIAEGTDGLPGRSCLRWKINRWAFRVVGWSPEPCFWTWTGKDRTSSVTRICHTHGSRRRPETTRNESRRLY